MRERATARRSSKPLDQHRQDRGIDVVFDCHDERLIQNPETNEIVGCYTLIGDDAEKKAVKASKGVILCTGGFEFNEELQAKYLKCYPMRGFYGWKYNEGDGIKIAQKVGADLWHMQQVCGGDDAGSTIRKSSPAAFRCPAPRRTTSR